MSEPETVEQRLLQEIKLELRGLRLAMVSEAEPLNDQRFLTLTDLERYAGVKRRTLEKYVRRRDNPLPHMRRPGDNAILVQWGVYKAWLQAQSADDDEEREAQDVLVELAGRR